MTADPYWNVFRHRQGCTPALEYVVDGGFVATITAVDDSGGGRYVVAKLRNHAGDSMQFALYTEAKRYVEATYADMLMVGHVDTLPTPGAAGPGFYTPTDKDWADWDCQIWQISALATWRRAIR